MNKKHFCHQCNGTGKFKGFRHSRPDEHGNVTATAYEGVCPYCNGRGYYFDNDIPIDIRINTHGNPMPEATENGDWVDLRSAERVVMRAGDHRLISLGVSIELPPGYEAHIAPRSSTFKNWGILLTNGVGVIDNSYNGDDDIWQVTALAMRDTIIEKGDRIVQFRIMEKQNPLNFIPTDCLGNKNRGGFGSTGTK